MSDHEVERREAGAVTPTEGVLVRLSTGERVYWTDGTTSEMTVDGLRVVASEEP